VDEANSSFGFVAEVIDGVVILSAIRRIEMIAVARVVCPKKVHRASNLGFREYETSNSFRLVSTASCRVSLHRARGVEMITGHVTSSFYSLRHKVRYAMASVNR
jgi:hypothetical protein